jgi:hypothetical protein
MCPQIPDPESKKPDDWDDEPETIPDPEASKPEDWDDEDDGEWEAPTIPNPKYKGEWKPKMMKNPKFKGMLGIAPHVGCGCLGPVHSHSWLPMYVAVFNRLQEDTVSKSLPFSRVVLQYSICG